VIAFLRIIGSVAKITKVTSQFKVVKDDLDDVVVRTAFDGKADYIVSGDKHLAFSGRIQRNKGLYS
jgi:putative PIN family toxin of toxin-antitoxin system